MSIEKEVRRFLESLELNEDYEISVSLESDKSVRYSLTFSEFKSLLERFPNVYFNVRYIT